MWRASRTRQRRRHGSDAMEQASVKDDWCRVISVTFLLLGPERYDSLEDFFENDDVNFDIDFDDAHDAAEV